MSFKPQRPTLKLKSHLHRVIRAQSYRFNEDLHDSQVKECLSRQDILLKSSTSESKSDLLVNKNFSKLWIWTDKLWMNLRRLIFYTPWNSQTKTYWQRQPNSFKQKKTETFKSSLKLELTGRNSVII